MTPCLSSCRGRPAVARAPKACPLFRWSRPGDTLACLRARPAGDLASVLARRPGERVAKVAALAFGKAAPDTGGGMVVKRPVQAPCLNRARPAQPLGPVH